MMVQSKSICTTRDPSPNYCNQKRNLLVFLENEAKDVCARRL